MEEYAICRFDFNEPDLDVVEQYTVGRTRVVITSDGRYLVREPPLSARAEAVWRRLMRNIHCSFTHDEISRDEIVPLLKRTLEEESRATDDFDAWKREKESVEYYMIRDILGHAELDALVRDPRIEDILCLRWERPAAVAHRGYPHRALLETNVGFRSESEMSRFIQRTSQRYGDPPSQTRPMTSFSDHTGIRYTFTGNRRITPDSPTISIRKPSVATVTIYHLLESGILSALAAAYLWCMMDLKGFGLVIGAPSAGKTTMINSIFTMSNPNWHYYTIEDVLELRLPHRHVSRHQTTINSSLQGEDGGTARFGVFDLCKLSLRFRPDFVVVGEILGREADGLFQAAASGTGCVCSFHASNAEHALTRLEAPPISLSKSQTALITYVLHMSWILRKNERQRRLISITETSSAPSDPARKNLETVFWYDPESDRLMPDDADRLVARSAALQKMRVMLGVDDIRGNLEARMRVLRHILDDGMRDVERIHAAINGFYGIGG